MRRYPFTLILLSATVHAGDPLMSQRPARPNPEGVRRRGYDEATDMLRM